MPISHGQFWDAIITRGYDLFSGVPDSTFGTAFAAVADSPNIHYVPAVREDMALGVASAAHLVGRRAGVIMQNSGLGNVMNALTSFNILYEIPVLFVVGWRGFGGRPNDAPEHWIMGEKTEDILDLLEIPHFTLEEDNLDETLDGLLSIMYESNTPGALLVRPGVIG